MLQFSEITPPFPIQLNILPRPPPSDHHLLAKVILPMQVLLGYLVIPQNLMLLRDDLNPLVYPL